MDTKEQPKPKMDTGQALNIYADQIQPKSGRNTGRIEH